MNARLRALQVDPGLFTAPYDAGLTRGLESAGVEVVWASRALRRDEETELSPAQVIPIYYRGQEASVKRSGAAAKLRKGLSHVVSNRRLIRHAAETPFDVVHIQWALLPLADAWMVRRLAARSPVVLTLHDLQPFNDAATSRLQRLGLSSVLRAVSAVVVHTEAARQSLIAGGMDAECVRQIPHGPLGRGRPGEAPRAHGGPWTIVLVGKLQTYKGVDILIEAAALLKQDTRAALRIIVAGEALIDLKPLRTRVKELGLEGVIELRPGRLTEDQLDALMRSADTFVFPYRHIEASGVLYLALPYGRWLVASDLGAFRDTIRQGHDGALVRPGDIDQLAQALTDSVGRSPAASATDRVTSWEEIGRRTRDLYQDLRSARA